MNALHLTRRLRPFAANGAFIERVDGCSLSVEDVNGDLLLNRDVIATAVVASRHIVARRGKVAAGVVGSVGHTTSGDPVGDRIATIGDRP